MTTSCTVEIKDLTTEELKWWRCLDDTMDYKKLTATRLSAMARKVLSATVGTNLVGYGLNWDATIDIGVRDVEICGYVSPNLGAIAAVIRMFLVEFESPICVEFTWGTVKGYKGCGGAYAVTRHAIYSADTKYLLMSLAAAARGHRG